MESAFAIAKEFGRLSDWSLSNLEIQKLVYLAHMVHLGRTGQPLVFGQFEAWDYGPVHPALYHKAKVFGRQPVQNIFGGVADLQEGKVKDLVKGTFESLGGLGAGRLVNITHRPGGAWERNYQPGTRCCVISNADIKDEYDGLAANEAA